MLIMDVREPGIFGETRVSRMDPRTVRFCQESISLKFSDGKDVRAISDMLRMGTISVSNIPPIHVFQWNGSWHSSDNRRLWAFKNAGVESVPVVYIDKENVDSTKLSTNDSGHSIRLCNR